MSLQARRLPSQNSQANDGGERTSAKKDFQIKVSSHKKIKEMISSKTKVPSFLDSLKEDETQNDVLSLTRSQASNRDHSSNINNHRHGSKALDSLQIDIAQAQDPSKFANVRVGGKRPTCPIKSINPLESLADPKVEILSHECVTPKKTVVNEDNDGELLLEDDDSQNQSPKSNNDASCDSEKTDQDDGEDSNLDDQEEDQEALEKEKQKEIDEIREFAQRNGFQINYEKEKKEDESLANKPFKVTKEMLDKFQKEDQERMMKEMYVPPPLEILKRKYSNKEPVRTGFNQGLLPIKIKNNFECGRTPQGPHIIVTCNSALRRRERDISSREQSARAVSSRNGKRSASRDSSFGRMDYKQQKDPKENEQPQQPLGQPNQPADANEAEQQTVEKVVEYNKNSETSLRHLFYLEYKKNFQDGEKNPIVYSRFGKQCYNSEEKFDTNNFNQLIRTCNLKKLMKPQESVGFNNKDKKFSEPFSFPSCNYYSPTGPNDKTLVFESRFESGNLQLAQKVSENEYNLVLQNDINSKGHTQWFFFRVSNVRKGLKVKFNMLNMIKSKSLYNEGMKVLIYSEKKQEHIEQAEQENAKEESDDKVAKERRNEPGWIRGGEDLSYYQNNYRKEHQVNYQRYYYTFSFSHTFDYDNDEVYFAYSLPYTYTDLTDYLCSIQEKQLNYVTRNLLCRTIAGNKCEYLTITNRVPYEVDKKKEAVVITARTHPGESNGSWMMKGAIDFLISSDPKASELRDKYVFKIVPMMNPDGVINGNYRCSLAGCDLNRRWKYPSELLHPTVYYTKRLILNLAKERTLALYCDLHGHSRRKNIFMYGNNQPENQEASRVLPFLMSKLAQPSFSYDYSRFNTCRSKEHTARIAVWRELNCKCPNIFTMEASFCGPKPVRFEPHRGNKKAPSANELNYHFNTSDLTSAGTNLCRSLLLYREERENTMGLMNVEYLVQQYHIDKEAKLEQEELLKQQQIMIEQRKMLEQQNRFKNAVQHEDMPSKFHDVRASGTKEIASVLKSKDQGLQSTGKKPLKKAKTEALTDDISAPKPMKNEKGSKKVNYNLKESKDESDGASDSEPSEDNLEDEQIMKLIPKKFGKKKFIKGVEEKKVKKPVQTEVKPPKRPKAQLMPCMSQKKDKDGKTDRKASETKKPVPVQLKSQNLVYTKMRNNGKQRDVGTQIKYKGDGSDLSLMELDILRHTGCKWGKIIYPGFKGYIRPQDKHDLFRSAERYDEADLGFNSNQNQFSQSPHNNDSFIKDFNQEYNNLVENIGLRNSSQNTTQRVDDALSSQFSAKTDNSKQKAFGIENLNNQPERLRANDNTGTAGSTAIQNLQRKIREANFNEPKSLFSGSQRPQMNRGGPSSASHNKISKILGLPFDYNNQDTASKKHDQNNLFNLNLETVHEKVGEKSRITIDTKDQKEKEALKGSLSSNKNSVTKKILNGGIVQTLGHKIVKPLNLSAAHEDAESNKKLRLRKGSNGHLVQLSTMNGTSSNARCQSDTANQRGLGKQTSFASVAQQVLNNSSISSTEHQDAAQAQQKPYNFSMYNSSKAKPSFFDPSSEVFGSQKKMQLRQTANQHMHEYTPDQIGLGLMQTNDVALLNQNVHGGRQVNYSHLSHVAPSQMMTQMVKLQNKIRSDSMLSSKIVSANGTVHFEDGLQDYKQDK